MTMNWHCPLLITGTSSSSSDPVHCHTQDTPQELRKLPNTGMLSWLTELEQSIPGVQPNKVFGSRICVDPRVWHETPEEGQRTYRPKT